MKLNKQNAYYMLTAAVLLLMGMVNMGQAVMQTLVLPFIREDLGLSYSNASLMLTVRSAFTVIATLGGSGVILLQCVAYAHGALRVHGHSNACDR